MPDSITQFEADCVAAGVDPVDVLARAGLHRSTWFRWKSGSVSPTLRNFDQARDALKTLAPTAELGAPNRPVEIGAAS